MKFIKISTDGIENVKPVVVNGNNGNYLCFTHGQEGRGRWKYRIPLSAREFSAPQVIEENYYSRFVDLGDQEYKLIPLNKKDHIGNDLYLAVKGENDGKYLIFWYLSPGYRGGAKYNLEGLAKIIALGKEAQGAAGLAGGADCPIVLVEGPCKLSWVRTGRLYGSPSNWVAKFDGQSWTVLPEDEYEIESAALNW